MKKPENIKFSLEVDDSGLRTVARLEGLDYLPPKVDSLLRASGVGSRMDTDTGEVFMSPHPSPDVVELIGEVAGFEVVDYRSPETNFSEPRVDISCLAIQYAFSPSPTDA